MFSSSRLPHLTEDWQQRKRRRKGERQVGDSSRPGLPEIGSTKPAPGRRKSKEKSIAALASVFTTRVGGDGQGLVPVNGTLHNQPLTLLAGCLPLRVHHQRHSRATHPRTRLPPVSNG